MINPVAWYRVKACNPPSSGTRRRNCDDPCCSQSSAFWNWRAGVVISFVEPSRLLLLHSVSLLTRGMRATVAFTTVWCLGCCAFQPLVSRLLGASQGAPMVCAADEAATGQPGVQSSSDATAPTGSVAPSAAMGSPDADGCACLSCYAPAPATTTMALVLPSVEAQPSLDPAAPVSVSREPLVPPPQTTL
jgi:hypothetical protein